jgi:capsular polysaccharide biosynthesis protein
MEEQTNVKTIALKDLWDIFVKRAWIMILAAVIAVGSFFAYNTLTYVPEYSSKATLYILSDNENATANEIYSKFTVASQIVNDCDHMLKSHKVIDAVLEDLELKDVYNYANLKNRVTTKNPTDTRILEVTVTGRTPEEAKALVDSLCIIGKEAIDEAVGFEQINLFEGGVINNNPSNAVGIVMYILVALIAAILVYAVFFLMFMFDDSVWTDEEIEKYLGLSVLGDIPDANSTRKKGYGYRKYGKYCKYSSYSRYGAYGYNTENGNKTNETKNNGGKK